MTKSVPSKYFLHVLKKTGVHFWVMFKHEEMHVEPSLSLRLEPSLYHKGEIAL